MDTVYIFGRDILRIRVLGAARYIGVGTWRTVCIGQLSSIKNYFRGDSPSVESEKISSRLPEKKIFGNKRKFY